MALLPFPYQTPTLAGAHTVAVERIGSLAGKVIARHRFVTTMIGKQGAK
jgi:hypothetical protein